MADESTGGIGNTLMGIGAGANIVSGLASTITGVIGAVSQNRREDLKARYSIALSNLSFDEQNKLNEKLLNAKTQNDRLQILASAVTSIQMNAQNIESKNNTTLAIIIIGGGILLIGAAIAFRKT